MDKIKDKLVFVYNADSSVFSQVSDVVKKIVTPNNCECSLCLITYGVVSMKDEWKKYIDTIPLHKEFLHRDEFQRKYPEQRDTKLPAIYIFQNNSLDLLISSDDINVQKNINDLKGLIDTQLREKYNY